MFANGYTACRLTYWMLIQLCQCMYVNWHVYSMSIKLHGVYGDQHTLSQSRTVWEWLMTKYPIPAFLLSPPEDMALPWQCSLSWLIPLSCWLVSLLHKLVHHRIPVKIYEACQKKTNKMTCVPSKDSDQPGHLPSLIRVFPVCQKYVWLLNYPQHAQWRP